MSDTMPTPSCHRPCPICSRPAEERWRPFCSERCARIDLARWLSGVYALPAEERLEKGAPEDDPW